MSQNKEKAFVIMPFDTELNSVYELFIKKVLEEEGFEVSRADSINNQQNILHDIVGSILEASVVIADLTTSNANVYYELGIAHTFEKPVILMTQDIEEVPFDLRPYRLLSYSTNFAEIATAEERLREYARGFLEGSSKFGNPISDYKAVYANNYPVNNNVASRVREAAPTQRKEEEVEAEDDDKGYLDHLDIVEEGFLELKDLLEEGNSYIRSLGDTSKSVGEELSNLNADGSSGTRFQTKRILQSYAKNLDDIANQLRQVNIRYEETVKPIDTSLEFVITFQGKSKENAEALRKNLSDLNETLVSAEGARESMMHLFASMENVPKVEKQTNRSLRITRDEVQRLADNFDKTIATLSRITSLGNETLQRFDSAPNLGS